MFCYLVRIYVLTIKTENLEEGTRSPVRVHVYVNDYVTQIMYLKWTWNANMKLDATSATI